MKKILIMFLSFVLLTGGTVLANEWVGDDSIIRTKVTYKDVNENFWGYTAINEATRLGWFGGHTDGTFKPNDEIKRSEAAKAIANFLKIRTVTPLSTGYLDVDTTSWYSPYITAIGNLFYPTYGNEFKPSLGMTREDALYLLVNAYGYDSLIDSVDMSILDTFSDSMYINEKIRKYVAVGLHYGLLAGFGDGTLRPGAVLTRAQFATLLSRLYSMGKNNIPTYAMLERIEVSNGTDINITVGTRDEIRAEAIYADGKRVDFTKHLNIYTDDTDVLQIIENRIYGLKRGQGILKFNNPGMNGYTVSVTVN